VNVLDLARLVLAILLAVVFLGMGVNHFRPAAQRTMAAMLPPRMRWRAPFDPRTLVVFTGVCEVAGGLGLLFPATRPATAIALAVFLVCVFPANAYAAGRRDRFGALAIPLVPRAIGQVVLIAICVFIAF
jgi:uncharacterized membrane protein